SGQGGEGSSPPRSCDSERPIGRLHLEVLPEECGRDPGGIPAGPGPQVLRHLTGLPGLARGAKIPDRLRGTHAPSPLPPATDAMTRPRKVHTDRAPAAIGPYAQALVQAGWIFTSGQIALDPATGRLVEGPADRQAERVLDHLAAVLEAAGGGLDTVVRT